MDKKLKDLFLYNNFLAPTIISIDGPCGSGKTTIASEIENEFGYNILHMDDFYLPFYERDKNWMNIVAGHMDFERLISNVIVPYKNKCKTKYISYDCHSDKFMQEISIDLNKVLIIEGSYSSHPKLNKYIDKKIFIDIDSKKQIERLGKRNPDTVDRFISMWVSFENKYFDSLKLRESCDIYIKSI